MAIGPVQLIVLGFSHPEFHGEIIAELERLKESDTVRVIDALAVHKDADGEMEVAHLSNLSKDEAIEFGSKVGALIGLGHRGRGGDGRRRRGGRRGRSRRRGRVLRRGGVGRPGGHPQRLGGGADPARASLGGAAARRDRAARAASASATASSARSTWSRSGCSPARRQPAPRDRDQRPARLRPCSASHDDRSNRCSDPAEWPGAPRAASHAAGKRGPSSRRLLGVAEQPPCSLASASVVLAPPATR